jgi:hypothetical protein
MTCGIRNSLIASSNDLAEYKPRETTFRASFPRLTLSLLSDQIILLNGRKGLI